MQSTHWDPPAPHDVAICEGPVTHSPCPVQQPVGQLLALQVLLVQTPPLHCWFAAQTWQAPPPLPHAAGMLPGLTQVPLAEQHPEQLAGLQPPATH